MILYDADGYPLRRAIGFEPGFRRDQPTLRPLVALVGFEAEAETDEGQDEDGSGNQ